MGCTRSFWLPTQGWPAPPHHPQPIRRPENNRCPSSHPQPHRVQSLAPQAAPPPLPAAQMLRSQLQLRADPGPLEDAGPLAFAYSPPPAPVTSTTRPSNLNGEAISPACSDTHTLAELLEFRLRDKEDRRTGWGRTAMTCLFLRRRETPSFPSAPAQRSLGTLGNVVQHASSRGESLPKRLGLKGPVLRP